MKKLKGLLILLIGVLAFGLFSCSKEEVKTTYSISQEEATLTVGENIKLSIKDDGIIIIDGISWESTDKNVCSVSNGIVKAIKMGECDINARLDDALLTCHIVVKAKPGISISTSKLAIEVNGSKKLELIKDGKPVTSGVIWKSSDIAIATVENGVVKGIAIGDTTITAQYENKSYSCKISVLDKFEPVGSFYASKIVPEMDNIKFEFDLELKADGSYVYSRRDAGKGESFIAAEVVAKGNYTYSDLVLKLEAKSFYIQFRVIDKDTIESIGEIITGGVDAELTFERVEK